jgi:hypothetical protein
MVAAQSRGVAARAPLPPPPLGRAVLAGTWEWAEMEWAAAEWALATGQLAGRVDAREVVVRQRSRAVMRAAFVLGRHRLGRRLGARAGALGAVAVALVFGYAASSGADLSAERNAGLVAGCLRWASWLGAGPLALALARSDDEPGLTALARLAGIEAGLETAARGVAAANQIALRVALPGLVVCLAGLVRVPSLRWAALAIGVTLAALVVAGVLAVVAAGCERLAPDRGRSLFLALVFVPHFAAQSSSIEGWSIPGVLDAAISLFTGGRVA